ncbi:MAG: hypothetical protein JW810_01420 [Sedimentisphaerales bacterium]|nr:hypothetical protein [Sedimentisphaerales bacterium]
MSVSSEEHRQGAAILWMTGLLVWILAWGTGCGSGGGAGGILGVGPAAGSAAGRVQFTVVLAQYIQEDRNQLAGSLQVRARSLLGSDDVWMEFEQGRLTVNYGHFDDIDKAERELERVRSLYSQLGLGPSNLQFSYLRELPQPDPPAPQEWNLPFSGCSYTLEMAVFFNVPEKGYFNRKADAVQAVRNLRAEGKQAYFLHGPQASWVYVECLPPTIFQRSGDDGQVHNSLSPLVNALRKKYQYHENGQRIYDIARDKNGRRVRVPRLPRFIDVLAQTADMR